MKQYDVSSNAPGFAGRDIMAKNAREAFTMTLPKGFTEDSAGEYQVWVASRSGCCTFNVRAFRPGRSG